jgi:hypothetical protein
MMVASPRKLSGLVSARNGNRPGGGYGMIGSDRRAPTRTTNQPGIRIRPSLRDGFSIARVPGNKLPATIIQSLRDNSPLSLRPITFHFSPFTASRPHLQTIHPSLSRTMRLPYEAFSSE